MTGIQYFLEISIIFAYLQMFWQMIETFRRRRKKIVLFLCKKNGTT